MGARQRKSKEINQQKKERGKTDSRRAQYLNKKYRVGKERRRDSWRGKTPETRSKRRVGGNSNRKEKK